MPWAAAGFAQGITQTPNVSPAHVKGHKAMGFIKANFVPLVIGVVIGRFVWPVVANRLPGLGK